MSALWKGYMLMDEEVQERRAAPVRIERGSAAGSITMRRGRMDPVIFSRADVPLVIEALEALVSDMARDENDG